MSPNARHIIDQPPRSKLQAFGDECPEVVECLRSTQIVLEKFTELACRSGDDKLLACALVAAADNRKLLARMAGEEPR